MDDKRKMFLDAAIQIAGSHGLAKVTRGRVAAACRTSTGSVNYVFGNMSNLVDEVVREAIKNDHLPVIAEAIAQKLPVAREVDEMTRIRALMTLA